MVVGEGPDQTTQSFEVSVTRHSKSEHLLLGLGASISKRRMELGLSQEELAEKSKVHRTYISDVERGVRNISILTLERISLALDIPLGALFAWIPPVHAGIQSEDGASGSKKKRSS
jgi:transcriptional regulator with XRE-family HTH domain